MKISRRKFIEAAALLGGIYLFTPGALFPAEAAPLRPPGALAEKEFLAKCIRCLKCGEVCPTNAIKYEDWPFGQSSGTPTLSNLRSNPCKLCMRCTNVCPSGALTPIPYSPKGIFDNVAIGLANIDLSHCFIVTGQLAVCHRCVRECPTHAIKPMGPMRWPVITNQLCVGCGLCENVCPANTIKVKGYDV